MVPFVRSNTRMMDESLDQLYNKDNIRILRPLNDVFKTGDDSKKMYTWFDVVEFNKITRRRHLKLNEVIKEHFSKSKE